MKKIYLIDLMKKYQAHHADVRKDLDGYFIKFYQKYGKTLEIKTANIELIRR